MKKLSDIKKEIDAKKQKHISIEKKYDTKLSEMNNKNYQKFQIDCINLIEFTDNIDNLKLSLLVNFMLPSELIDSLINIVFSNSIYSHKNCNSNKPACTYIHRLEL